MNRVLVENSAVEGSRRSPPTDVPYVYVSVFKNLMEVLHRHFEGGGYKQLLPPYVCMRLGICIRERTRVSPIFTGSRLGGRAQGCIFTCKWPLVSDKLS